MAVSLLMVAVATCSPGQGPAAVPAVPTPSPAPTPVDPNHMLPDLQTLPPFDLRVEVGGPAGRRLLWFANTIWNAGAGPMELRGEPDPASGVARAVQRVHHRDGGTEDRAVGAFYWHAEHTHWHFDRAFAEYEVWAVGSNGALSARVAAAGKTTWCITDTYPVLPYPAQASRAAYLTCGPERQGTSVGWGDTYDNTLEGQHVDITELPDGRYALQSTANPERLLLEAEYQNNSAVTLFDLTGAQVLVAPPPSPPEP